MKNHRIMFGNIYLFGLSIFCVVVLKTNHYDTLTSVQPAFIYFCIFSTRVHFTNYWYIMIYEKSISYFFIFDKWWSK